LRRFLFANAARAKRTELKWLLTEIASLNQILYVLAPYLSAVETLVNVAFKLVPMLLTAATITIERPPAIMAYSIAVAADSLAKKAWAFVIMMPLCCGSKEWRLT